MLEPYFTGSHRAWAEGYAAASRHDVRIRSMPGRFWRWRMHGAAVTLARRVADDGRPDAILATDMLDIATMRGLLPAGLRNIPVVAYFHENQLAYPGASAEPAWTASRARRAARRDEHYAFINLTTCLSADEVWWNSAFNRDSFLGHLPTFLRRFPDERLDLAGMEGERCARVMPLGLDLTSLAVPPAIPRGRTPRVVWNHRWEHDKGPEEFFAALDRVDDLGVEFDLIVLGESFGQAPPVFERARERYGARVLAWGHVPTRREYAAWLRSADVVVSTAQQEFFGASVCEAVWCGARPILPNRLSYPELVPEEARDRVLYRTHDELAAMLARALTEGSPDVTNLVQRAVARFDWQEMAPRYDARLEELVRVGCLQDARGAPTGADTVPGAIGGSAHGDGVSDAAGAAGKDPAPRANGRAC